jgi:hypothetical protein
MSLNQCGRMYVPCLLNVNGRATHWRAGDAGGGRRLHLRRPAHEIYKHRKTSAGPCATKSCYQLEPLLVQVAWWRHDEEELKWWVRVC